MTQVTASLKKIYRQVSVAYNYNPSSLEVEVGES
jgi:hypothetical protein